MRGGKVFGTWDAPITDLDERIAAPTSARCVWCGEVIADGDTGRIAPAGHVEHRECSLRNVLGGIGHLVDHGRWCKTEGSDAGLTRRQSALLAWEFFERTQLRKPDPEARLHFEQAIEALRREAGLD